MGEDVPDRNSAVVEFLNIVRVWFRDYKIPDGKPANKFAYDGRLLSKVRHVCVCVRVCVCYTSPQRVHVCACL